MKITNKNHVVLHKEAHDIIQAILSAPNQIQNWNDGNVWDWLDIVQYNNYNYPTLNLYNTNREVSISIGTVPDYTKYDILGYCTVAYNWPIPTPLAVRIMKEMIGGKHVS